MTILEIVNFKLKNSVLCKAWNRFILWQYTSTGFQQFFSCGNSVFGFTSLPFLLPVIMKSVLWLNILQTIGSTLTMCCTPQTYQAAGESTPSTYAAITLQDISDDHAVQHTTWQCKPMPKLKWLLYMKYKQLQCNLRHSKGKSIRHAIHNCSI